jgi:hypothetical protein
MKKSKHVIGECMICKRGITLHMLQNARAVRVGDKFRCRKLECELEFIQPFLDKLIKVKGN